MGSLNNIVSVNITRSTKAPSRAGFGTGAFVSGSASFSTATRIYSDYAEMSADAAVGPDSLVFGAAYFGQQVSPTKLTVIKEGTEVIQVGDLVFDADLIADNSTAIEIDGVAIAGSPVVYATSHADTLTAIAVAIAAEATVTTAVSDGVSTITVTFTDGYPNTLSATVTLGLTQAGAVYADTTAGQSAIVAGLTAGVLENNDWYAPMIHSRTDADILAVAKWVQANSASNPKLFFAQTDSADVIDSSKTTDIASVLQAGAYFRTSIWYHALDAEYLEGGVTGGQLPSNAGSITWAYKSVSGVTVDSLSSAEKSAAHAKACNTYDTVASIDITEEGKVSDSPFEWIDVIRGVDWIQANVAADVYGLLVRSPKVPYTSKGISQIKTAILNRLIVAQARGILSSDIAPVVTVPDILGISAEDKSTRTLNDVTFTGVLAGAIQKINIAGTVTL